MIVWCVNFDLPAYSCATMLLVLHRLLVISNERTSLSTSVLLDSRLLIVINAYQQSIDLYTDNASTQTY